MKKKTTKFISILLSSFLVGLWAGAVKSAEMRIIDEQNGEITFEVLFDPANSGPGEYPEDYFMLPGYPRLRYVRFYLALSQAHGYEIEVLQGKSLRRRGKPPEIVRDRALDKFLKDPGPVAGMFPESPVRVSGPFYYRKRPLIALDCFAEQVDYERGTGSEWLHYTVRVRYPKNPAAGTGIQADPFLTDMVINKRFISSSNGTGSLKKTAPPPDPHFSRSANWIKIKVTARGMYVLSGSDLFALGVDIDKIDPATLKIFTAGGLEQPLSYTDTTGTWNTGHCLRECSIALNDGGDGKFDAQDEIVFYALGLSGWLDYYSPLFPRDVFYEHPYAKENVYYISWNGSFPESQKLMNEPDAGPTAAPSRTSFEKRLFFEKNIVKNFDFGGDGWLWLDIIKTSIPNEEKLLPFFQVDGLVKSQPQTFKTVAIAEYCGSSCNSDTVNANSSHHIIYLINNKVVAEKIWTTPYGANYEDGTPVVQNGFFLQDGQNRLVLRIPRDLNSKDFMYFDSFSVTYERKLAAAGNELSFSTPDTSGVVNFEVGGFTGNDPIRLFDVTDQFNPSELKNFTVEPAGGNTRLMRFSTSLTGSRKHFWTGSVSSFKRPSNMIRYYPTELRNTNISPDMLVVYNADLQGAADRIAFFRRSRLSGFSNPFVETANCEEIFDNFSGGVHDPLAIRNYCRFLYDRSGTGGSAGLSYLLLMGDANTDYKNIATSQPDFLPTNLNLHPHSVPNAVAYATDDWFALMDIEDEVEGAAVPDIAVGRLPAANINEANTLVDKIIAYEESNDFGPWRSKIILVADDENSGTGRHSDDMFIIQSEILANSHVPYYLDVFKIYLTEFPSVGTIKPDSRRVFLDQWNKGGILINYIGHGSSQQMSDEQVFLGPDANNLFNGKRLPLMMAMSCTIGDFDNASNRSLSEMLLLRAEGGAIGIVAASNLTYISPNFNFNWNLFDELFPPSPGPGRAVGRAVIQSKLNSILAPQLFLVENNEKYNLLTDPALVLNIPRDDIQFYDGVADTITAGLKKNISGEVLRGSEVDTVFQGTAYLTVRESDDTTGYKRLSDGFFIPYHYPGGIIYRDSTGVDGGIFDFSFHVPRFPNKGGFAQISVYAEDGSRDASVTKKDIELAYPDSSTTKPKDGPPRIELGFKGGLDIIKPGAILEGFIKDSDGINILKTNNEGKHVLIIDQSNYGRDVTDYFTFGPPGGADTTGILSYPLDEISVGSHSAVYKVSDSFGQIAFDTLAFTVIDPMQHYAEAVFNYPNPFEDSTHFLFHLSEPASIKLDVFTSSGKKIRSLDGTMNAGKAWLYWDGRDYLGEEIANGVYLFVATISFMQSDSPSKIIRGKLVKIE